MKSILRLQMLLLTSFLYFYSNAQSNSIAISKGAFAPKYSLPKGEIVYVNNIPIAASKRLNIQVLDQQGDSIHILLQNQDMANILAIDSSHDVTSLFVGRGANLHLKYTDWDTSPLSIPIKIRPSIDDTPLEFVGEFTLGSYIGFQTGSKSISDFETFHYSQTFSGFAAPTMVKINPEVAATDMSNLILGFSVGLGYIVNLNDFQIGVVGGADYISGDASKTWIYQGKPWFSFTVGFDFNDE